MIDFSEYKILDKNDNVITNPDIDKGYLIEDTHLVKHHEAVEAVEEEGHWVTIAEYPNGGKDIDWVVDVAKVEAKEAWDEYEDILRYIEYTQEELDRLEEERNKPTLEQQIKELQDKLSNMELAYAEGVASI